MTSHSSVFSMATGSKTILALPPWAVGPAVCAAGLRPQTMKKSGMARMPSIKGKAIFWSLVMAIQGYSSGNGGFLSSWMAPRYHRHNYYCANQLTELFAPQQSKRLSGWHKPILKALSLARLSWPLDYSIIEPGHLVLVTELNPILRSGLLDIVEH